MGAPLSGWQLWALNCFSSVGRAPSFLHPPPPVPGCPHLGPGEWGQHHVAEVHATLLPGGGDSLGDRASLGPRGLPWGLMEGLAVEVLWAESTE